MDQVPLDRKIVREYNPRTHYIMPNRRTVYFIDRISHQLYTIADIHNPRPEIIVTGASKDNFTQSFVVTDDESWLFFAAKLEDRRGMTDIYVKRLK